MTERTEVPLRDAATVLLLRDGFEGLEVFMLERNLRSDFAGGAYVFPGGAVDPADRAADLDGLCEGRSDADASRRLGVDGGGLAYWVAAIRESFEEAGVLLAYDAAGAIVDLDDVAGTERWAEHRAAVDKGARRLIEVCQAEDLRLAVDGMHYFGHWITPEGAPRRYDTRFFLAAAPTRQTPLHDDRETIAHEWIRPADGLARVQARELTMMPPTTASLRAISQFDTAADALAAATEITRVPAICPRVIAIDGGVRIVLPGDRGYDGDPGYDGGPATPDRPLDWTDLATAGTTGFDQETS